MWSLFTLAFMALAGWGIYLWLTGQDPESQLNKEVNRLKEQNKDRDRIVYLRSFATERFHAADLLNAFGGNTLPGTDAYWKDVGHTVTSFLSVIAPAQELACPTKSWSMRPWASARPFEMTAADHEWQNCILGWLPTAPLVIIQLDVSTGLAWELNQVARVVLPTRVLLVLPPSQAE